MSGNSLESFILFTDSSFDMPEEYIAENDIRYLQLTVVLKDKMYLCNALEPKSFYDGIRAGEMPTTTQVNMEAFLQEFEPLLQQGQDILYLAFSSGLSGTCQSGQAAAKILSGKYPDRHVLVVDTLCASMGQGLMVHIVNEMRKSGSSIHECCRWATDNRLRLLHLVTVDDLMHLYRGGRVSRTSAVVGSVLGIKPMIIVDDKGKLKVVGKTRGRRQSLSEIVEMAVQRGAENADNNICFISHGDCLEDAEYVAELIKKRLGIQAFMYSYVGPVIGAHTGPGVIAVFMMGDGRETPEDE